MFWPLLLSVSLADDGPTVDTELISFVGDGQAVSGSQLLEMEQLRAARPAHRVEAGMSGEAAYSIPIEVAPARLAPSVRLVYSSEASEHTWVARGWSIDHGLPRVQKITGRAAVEAYGTLNEPWRISGGGFDGVLHRVGGTWVYSATSDTTEVEIDWSQGQLTLSRGGTITWLKEPNSGQTSGQAVEMLPFQQVDAANNSVYLSWSNDRLQRIEYGSRCSQAVQNCDPRYGPDGAPRAFVHFEYEARPDVSVVAVNGRVQRRDQVLRRIVATSELDGQVESRIYHVQSHLESRGRLLKMVTLEGADLPIAELLYTDWNNDLSGIRVEDVGLSRSLRHTEGGSPSTATETVFSWSEADLFDFTGDAYPEFHQVGSVPKFLERAPGARSSEGIAFDRQDRQLPADLSGPLASTGSLERSAVVECGDTTQRVGIAVMVDVDGDGVLDRIDAGRNPIGDEVSATACSENIGLDSATPHGFEIAYGRDGGFEQPVQVLAPVAFPRVGAPVRGRSGRGSYSRDGAVELADMNGDGWLDLVVFGPSVTVYLKHPERTEGWDLTTPVVWYGSGTADQGDVHAVDHELASASVMVSYLVPEDPNAVDTQRAMETYAFSGLRDMNGDGLPDYVVACPDMWEDVSLLDLWWCGSEDVASEWIEPDDFYEPWAAYPPPGSGRPAPDQWTVYFNTGAGFAEPEPWYLPENEWDPSHQVYALSRVDEGVPYVGGCVLTENASGDKAGGGDPFQAAIDTWSPNGPGLYACGVDDIEDPDGGCRTWMGIDIDFNPNIDIVLPAPPDGEEPEFLHMDPEMEWIQPGIEPGGGGGGVGEQRCHTAAYQYGEGDPELRWQDHYQLHVGRPQRVLAKLVDYDADGRPDYVDFEHGLWYRNEGLGFGEAQSLPDWMPSASSVSISGQLVLMFAEPDGTPLPDQSTSESVSDELVRVADLDGNGLLDVLRPHSLMLARRGADVRGYSWDEYYVDSDVVIEPHGLYFHQLVRPGLLQRVQRPTSAVTDIGYSPSSYMDPAGVDRYLDGDPAGPEHLDRPGRSVVTRLSTWDPVTGARGWTERDYLDGMCEGGVCQGYAEVTEEVFTDELKAGCTTVTPVSRTVTSFLLNRDYALPERVTFAYDVGEDATCGALHDGVEVVNTYTRDQVFQTWNARLGERRTTVTGERSGSRTSTIRISRNATGHVELVEHEASDRADVLVQDRIWWGTDRSGSVVVPILKERHAVDPDTQQLVLVDHAEYAYDGEAFGGDVTRGWLTEESVCSGPRGDLCGERVTTSLGWDDRGALVSTEVMADGALLVSESSSDFLLNGTFPTVSTDILGNETHQEPDAWGRVIAVVDANGVRTETDYDVEGRPRAERVQGVGGPMLDTKSWTYGYGVAQTVEVETSIWNAAGSSRQFSNHYTTLDGFGEPVEEFAPHPDGWVRVQHLRDGLGLFRASTEPTVVSRGPDAQALSFDTGAVAREARHDGAGRERWRRSGDDRPVQVSMPEPGLVVTEDGEGYTSSVITDSLGRVREVWRGQRGSSERVGVYSYDGRGRVRTFEDGNGNIHDYRYDGVGRLREVHRKAVGEDWEPYRTFAWHGPWLVEERDGTGQPVVTYKRDELGRPVLERVLERDPSGAETWQAYTWTWDESDTGEVWRGALFATTDPSGDTHYRYDEQSPWGALGRRTSASRQSLGQASIDFAWEHDFLGRAEVTHWPSGAVVSDHLHSSGHALSSEVAFPGGRHVATYGYDTFGALAEVQLDDSTVRMSTSRSRGDRVDRIDVSGKESLSIAYGYSENGWLTEKLVEGEKSSYDFGYGYDALGRVSSFDVGGSLLEGYSYDVVGNMTEHVRREGSSLVRWEYARARFNEIAGRGASTGEEDVHDWDPLTSRMLSWTRIGRDHHRAFGYDGHGRLVAIEDADAGRTSLFYDASNDLVYEERDRDVYERFLGHRRSPEGVVESVLPFLRLETDPNGAQSARVAVLDQDGSALWTLGASTGRVVSQEVRGPYGVPVSDPGYHVGPVWLVDGLHGSEADRSNEVVHHGVRHMLHRDGLWMQPEPLLASEPARLVTQPGTVGSSYAEGNPLLLEDRSGELPLLLQLALGCSPQDRQAAWDAMQELTKSEETVETDAHGNPINPGVGYSGRTDSTGKKVLYDASKAGARPIREVFDEELPEMLAKKFDDPEKEGWSVVSIEKAGPLRTPDPDLGMQGNRYYVLFEDFMGDVTDQFSVNFDPATGSFGIIKPSSGK